MSKEKFADLANDVKAYYMEENGFTYEEYVEGHLVHETPKFHCLEDALSFVLFQNQND